MNIKKTCNKCSESKLLSEFHNLKRSKDGKNTICKICIKKRRDLNKKSKNKINKFKIDENEIFKPVEYTQNKYFVSNYGRVYSLSDSGRKTFLRKTLNNFNITLINPKTNKKMFSGNENRYTVNLYIAFSRCKIYIDSLVLHNFCENIPQKYLTNWKIHYGNNIKYKDENRANLNINNLEYTNTTLIYQQKKSYVYHLKCNKKYYKSVNDFIENYSEETKKINELVKTTIISSDGTIFKK